MASTSSTLSWATACSSACALLLIALRCFMSVHLTRNDMASNEIRIAAHDPGVDFDTEIHPVAQQVAVVIVGVLGIAITGVALVIAASRAQIADPTGLAAGVAARSEEHTSELQSRPHLVCRLLLEKK